MKCLKNIIHYNKNDDLNKFIENILGFLMNMFGEQNHNVILRKLVIIDILEFFKNCKAKIKLLLNQIDVNSLFNYFINLYNKKIDTDLYGVLLELIASIGDYSLEKNNKIFQDILSYVIKLIKDFEFNDKNKEKSISICELSKSLVRILPIVIKKIDNTNLILQLISDIISLIKTKNIMTLNFLSDNDFEITDFLGDFNDSNIIYQNIYNTQTEEFSCLLSILFCILNNIKNIYINYQNIIDIENDIIPLINYRKNKNIRNKSAKIIAQLIFLINNNEQKRIKSISYINIFINAIEKETNSLTACNLFERIKEIIESNENFLNNEEINKLFHKFCFFFENIKIKRNQLIEKQNNCKESMIKNKKRIKEEDSDYEYLNELILKEIKNLEDIEIEISDIIGILLKTHNDKCNKIIEEIINRIIPSCLNSNNISETKIALYLSDDLIEYVGQVILGDKIWDNIYNILIKFILNDNFPLRQAAAYGIGIFAFKTKNNFIKYSKGLIENLFKSLSLSTNFKNNNKIKNNEEFLLAFDNIIASIGKIIRHQFNDKIVQENINEIFEKWIMNLPIKYDETEWEQQHEWMVNLFFSEKDIIPVQCYSHYFESLADIYQSKYSNNNIDNKIEMIFISFIQKDEKLKNILAIIYENASIDIKNKLNILAKKN